MSQKFISNYLHLTWIDDKDFVEFLWINDIRTYLIIEINGISVALDLCRRKPGIKIKWHLRNVCSSVTIIDTLAKNIIFEQYILDKKECRVLFLINNQSQGSPLHAVSIHGDSQHGDFLGQR